MSGNNARIQSGATGALVGGSAPLRVSLAALGVIGGKAAPFGRVQQQGLGLITGGAENRTVARIQNASLGLIVAEGDIPDDLLDIRAFTYDLDGHIFYGLHVNARGTFMYDTATNQWARWRSGSLTLWNTQFHTRWAGEYYASSLIDNSLVRIDPDEILDDSFRVNTFSVNGRLEYKDRRFSPNPQAQIFGSVGINGGDVSLSYSEDDGATYSTPITINVPAGQREKNVLFYNLGSITAPGRLYRIEDTGTMQRIQSLVVRIGNAP